VIGDLVVGDAVVHPYNLAPENQAPDAEAQLDAVYAAHTLATPADRQDFQLTREEFFRDFPFEALASALFAESPIDFAVLHALPNLGFANSYVTDPCRAAEFRDRHPGRFLLYGTVDTPLAENAISQLEWQVERLAIDGLKVYPSFFYDGVAKGWRLDGEDFATPLLEAARDLGIRNVAIHKALWLPPAPREAFRVEDLEIPLGRFPEINFHIVHAGMAFVEETAALLRDHPNLYATLESTFGYLNVRPRQFADALGRLLQAAGSERLLFGSGTNLMHPRPLLEAFERFQIPADLVAAHGYPELTDEDRANILGANLLRLHDLDSDLVRARIADDEYAAARAHGDAAPWSGVR
jgi:predicted TIM-barrel fold metal-dependent hydrolase